MAKQETLLTIIVVSYNTKDLTLQTLYSAIQDILASPELAEKCEIIVIDNNSQDDSVAALKKFAKTSSVPIKIITNSKNLGFSAANNQGIDQAAGEYLLLLNSDTLVQAGALQKMVMSFQEIHRAENTAVLSSETGKLDKLGILAASLINWDGTYQPQGGDKPTLFSIFTQMFFLDDLPLLGRFLPSTQHTGKNTKLNKLNSDKLIQKYWVGGTAMMIHRDVIEEIGQLDSNIFMYGEDVEFCMRAKKHHWDVAEHPNAKITHFSSASAGSKNAIIGEFKGYYYIWSKHLPLWQLPILRLILQTGALLRKFVFGTMMKDEKRAAIYAEALQALLKK